MFNIHLPEFLSIFSSKLVSIASTVALIMANLTVKDATAIAADNTNNKLPFTAAKDLNSPK